MAKPVTSLRVLQAPQNIASLPSHTVRGLEQAGFRAASLIYSNQPIQASAGLRVVSVHNKNLPVRLAGKLSWLIQFAAASMHTDIIHWYYGRSLFDQPIDIALVRLLRKPALVEWMGSDIRIPDVEFAENPYYTRAFHAGYEKAPTESKEKSRKWQKRFADANFSGAAAIGMRQYVFPDLFPHVFDLPRRLLVSDYPPCYPQPGRRLLVVHSPSAPVTKGTACVLEKVSQLQKRYEFDFQLVQNMPRGQAMEILRRADIFLDQFVLGDYGMASLEAMAYGKPVICYIKPSLAQAYGPELPILNASQDTLLETLEELILDENLRIRLGKQSREYVERYHDMRVIAPLLLNIYSQLVS
jgi:hypothetical protein